MNVKIFLQDFVCHKGLNTQNTYLLNGDKKNVLFINKGLFEKTFFRDFLTKCCRGQSSFMGMNFFCNPKLQMRFLLLKRKIVSSCNLTWNLCPFHFDIFFLEPIVSPNTFFIKWALSLGILNNTLWASRFSTFSWLCHFLK